ncbi:MAG: hypothetical protein ACRD2Z_08420 [Thermoanaerobaculia bacterium]
MNDPHREIIEPGDPGAPAGAAWEVHLSVVVPVTGEPCPLDWLYREYASALRRRGVSFEFLYVVKPSEMELATVLRGLIEQGEPIRVFTVGPGVQESEMLVAAQALAKGEFLLVLPAYPRVRAEGLDILLDAVEEGADLATARRTVTRGSRLNRLQRHAFHTLVKWGIGGSFRDLASGVRAMRREVLDRVPIHGYLSRFLPVLAEREGFRVEEIAVAQHPRDTVTRVYAPGIYLGRMIDFLGLFFLVRFTHKPLRFFGLVGSLLSGVGAFVLVWLLVERLQGQAIADRPMLLVGVLLFVLGIQAFAIGLVGEIIVHLSSGGERRLYRTREVTPQG